MKNLKTFEQFINEDNSIKESEVNERRKPITKKHWDKADDDQKEEWLLQAFSDPDDAMEYVEMDWNDLPPQATSNMYESVNEAAKPSPDFGFGAKELKDLKVGDFVWRQMERHNPQLGTYYTLSKSIIGKITGKKVYLESYGGIDPNFYDRGTGEQLKTSQAAYGSAYYTILTHQEALSLVKADPEKYKKNADLVKGLKLSDVEQFCSQNNENYSVNEAVRIPRRIKSERDIEKYF
jgi:hypothetical protein